MSALAGRKVRVQVATTNVAGAQTDELVINREHIDITDKDDAGVRKLLDEIGTFSMSMTCSGILKDNSLIEWGADSTEVLKTMTFVIDGIGSYAGQFGMASFTQGGNDGAEAATFQATFESAGAVAFTALATPTNIILPAISGTVQDDETLTAFAGTWTGSPTFSYQWQQDASGNGVFANITGATGATFTPVTANVGNALRVIVTATNSAGTATATSAATVVVAA
jgi:predicted secreted protein